ncbi:putative RNA-binding protein 46 [Stigmatopora nigra]
MAEPTNGMRLWGKNPWVNWAKPKNSKEAKIRPANVGQALYNPSPSSTAETLQREMEPIEAVYSNLPVTPVLPGMKMSPLFPGMTLSHTGLPQLQRYQITSAVSLLELYCGLHNLPPPQYSLYSLPDERGNLWPVYEVVMPLTHSRFLPHRFCARLDDALNALWNLDPVFARDWPHITSVD